MACTVSRGPPLGFTLCCCCLTIINDLQVKGPAISLCTGLQIKYPVLLRTYQGRGFCLCLHPGSSVQWGLLPSRDSQEEERGKSLVSPPPRAAHLHVCSSSFSLPSCSPTHSHTQQSTEQHWPQITPDTHLPLPSPLHRAPQTPQKSPVTLLKHSILRTHCSAEELTPRASGCRTLIQESAQLCCLLTAQP